LCILIIHTRRKKGREERKNKIDFFGLHLHSRNDMKNRIVVMFCFIFWVFFVFCFFRVCDLLFDLF